jgi:hypothetical protein
VLYFHFKFNFNMASRKATWTDYSIYLPAFIAMFRWGVFLVLRVIPSLFYVQIGRQIKRTQKGIENREYRTVCKEDVTVVVTVYQPPQGFMPAMRQVRANGACKVPQADTGPHHRRRHLPSHGPGNARPGRLRQEHLHRRLRAQAREACRLGYWHLNVNFTAHSAHGR